MSHLKHSEVASMQHDGSKIHSLSDGSYRGIPEKLSYTIAEACMATGLGRTSIYALIKEHKIRSLRAAGRRLILRSDLEAYLRSCSEGHAPV